MLDHRNAEPTRDCVDHRERLEPTTVKPAMIPTDDEPSHALALDMNSKGPDGRKLEDTRRHDALTPP